MVKCKKCGGIVNEPVDASIDNLTPCPSCGSKERHFEELELSVG